MTIWQSYLFLAFVVFVTWQHLRDQIERRHEKSLRLRAEGERDGMEWNYVSLLAVSILKDGPSPSVIETTTLWNKTPIVVVRTGYDAYPFLVAGRNAVSSGWQIHRPGEELSADTEDVLVNDLIRAVQAMDALGDDAY
jgi:hypothetical protein